MSAPTTADFIQILREDRKMFEERKRLGDEQERLGDAEWAVVAAARVSVYASLRRKRVNWTNADGALRDAVAALDKLENE